MSQQQQIREIKLWTLSSKVFMAFRHPPRHFCAADISKGYVMFLLSSELSAMLKLYNPSCTAADKGTIRNCDPVDLKKPRMWCSNIEI